MRSLQLGRESVESVSRVPSQLHVMLTGAAGSAAGVNPFRFGMPRILPVSAADVHRLTVYQQRALMEFPLFRATRGSASTRCDI